MITEGLQEQVDAFVMHNEIANPYMREKLRLQTLVDVVEEEKGRQLKALLASASASFEKTNDFDKLCKAIGDARTDGTERVFIRRLRLCSFKSPNERNGEDAMDEEVFCPIKPRAREGDTSSNASTSDDNDNASKSDMDKTDSSGDIEIRRGLDKF